MNTSEETPKQFQFNEEEKEESNLEKEKDPEKDKIEEENDALRQNKLDVFTLYNNKIKKICGKKAKIIAAFIAIFLFSLLLFLISHNFFLTKSKSNDLKISENQNKENTILLGLNETSNETNANILETVNKSEIMDNYTNFTTNQTNN